jgi:hypothetical protein
MARPSDGMSVDRRHRQVVWRMSPEDAYELAAFLGGEVHHSDGFHDDLRELERVAAELARPPCCLRCGSVERAKRRRVLRGLEPDEPAYAPRGPMFMACPSDWHDPEDDT